MKNHCSQLNSLVSDIAAISDRQKKWSASDWPAEQLQKIADANVYHWFVSQENGGAGWSAAEIAQGYIALGSACLTSTFIVTQRVAALSRIAKSENDALKQRLLPALLDATAAATVGISHLTTSRRHVKPVLRVERTAGGWVANGMAPWVTGASQAEYLLLGAVVENDNAAGAENGDADEVLIVVPTGHSGVTVERGFDLIALSASHTGVVKLDNVTVEDDWVVAGPKPSVLMTPTGGGAGGVQTSALALGLVRSAIRFLENESRQRPALGQTADALNLQFDLLLEKTLAIAAGQPNDGTLRADVNSLALRSTQAAMIAAKGASFVEGHPVGRWCREALFFLVWSCPQSVAEANLCELAASPS